MTERKRLYLVFNGVSPVLLDGVAQEFIEDGIETVGATVSDEHTAEWLRTGSPIEYDPLYSTDHVEDEWVPSTPDEDRIEDIEEQFGLPFGHPYLLADKSDTDQTHRDQKRWLQGWFDFYESVFHQFEPDLLLTNIVDSTAGMVPYNVAGAYDATPVWWKSTRVGHRYAVLVDSAYDSLTGVHRLFAAFRSGQRDPEQVSEAWEDAESYLREFESSGVKPGYFERRSGTFESPLQMARQSLQSAIGGSRFGPSGLTGGAVDTVRRAYTSARITEPPKPDESFVYFPLHAQPEPSTSILAPMYLNQAALAEQVSRSLPLTHKLYVKEHPRMFRDNPRSVRKYRQISSLPNVRVINVSADSHSLIRHSDVVVTPTGTPAFEAALSGTPAVTFGRAHFNELSMIKTCRCLSDLASVIDACLGEHESDEDELVEYLTALFSKSVQFPADIFGMTRNQQRTAAERIYPFILREIE